MVVSSKFKILGKSQLKLCYIYVFLNLVKKTQKITMIENLLK